MWSLWALGGLHRWAMALQRGEGGVSVGMGSSSLVTQPPQWEVPVKGDFTSFCQFPTWSLEIAMTFFAPVKHPGDPGWWAPAPPLFYGDKSWVLRAPTTPSTSSSQV